MAALTELVDDLERLAAVHAKLPVGSAAAHEAAERLARARCTLLCRLAGDAAELAMLRQWVHHGDAPGIVTS